MTLAPALAALVATVTTPAPPAVEVRLAEDAPVLGVEHETELAVMVTPPPAEHVAPRIVALGGQVEDLMRTGPGAFTGRFVFTSERYPQVAIVVVEVPGERAPARGVAFARLRAAASPAFHTDPGAGVTLRIGDREFGPEKAPADGLVRIPVVVPPGITFALARSVNAHGKATEETVDLRVPSFRRVLVAAPEAFVAGAVTEVAVYATDASGAPAAPGAITLATTGERPHPLGGRAGEARFLVRVPPSIRAGALRLEAALRGEPGTAVAVDVPLRPARPARLALVPDRARLTIGEGSAMRVYLAAEDAHGNATEADDALVLVDGARVETRPATDGRTMAIVPAPRAYAGRDHVAIEAAAGSGYARRRVPLVNVPGRASTAGRPREAPTLAISPRLGILWNARQALGPALTVEALGRRPEWPARLSVGLVSGYLHSDVRVAGLSGAGRVRVSHVPVLAVGRLRHHPTPRLSVRAGLGLGATVARTRVHSFTYEISGVDVAPAAELSVDGAMAIDRGEVVVGARYLLAPLGRVATGDTIEGNSAGAVLDVGYRLLW